MPESFQLSWSDTILLKKFALAIAHARKPDETYFKGTQLFIEMSEFLPQEASTIKNLFLKNDETRTRFQKNTFTAFYQEFKKQRKIPKHLKIEFGQWHDRLKDEFDKSSNSLPSADSQSTSEQKSLEHGGEHQEDVIENESIVPEYELYELVKYFEGSRWFIFQNAPHNASLTRAILSIDDVANDTTLLGKILNPEHYDKVEKQFYEVNCILKFQKAFEVLRLTIVELNSDGSMKELPLFNFNFEIVNLFQSILAPGSANYRWADRLINKKCLLAKPRRNEFFTPAFVSFADPNSDQTIYNFFEHGYFLPNKPIRRQPYDYNSLTQATNALIHYKQISFSQIEQIYHLFTVDSLEDLEVAYQFKLSREVTDDYNDYSLNASLEITDLKGTSWWSGSAKPNYEKLLITFILFKHAMNSSDHSEIYKQPLIIMINIPSRKVDYINTLTGILTGPQEYQELGCISRLVVLKAKQFDNSDLTRSERTDLRRFFTTYGNRCLVKPPSNISISVFSHLIQAYKRFAKLRSK